MHLKEVLAEHPGAPRAEQIRAILEAALIESERRNKEQRAATRGDNLKRNPSVSDAGKCPRAVYYSLRNVPPTNPPEADSLMGFGLGHAAEDWLAGLLENLGASIQREVPVEIEHDGEKFTGRIDMIVDIPGVGMLELKTTSSRAMSWMLKRGEAGRAEHRSQLNLYLHATGTPAGFLVYLVKDSTKGEPFAFPFEVAYDPAKALEDLTRLSGWAKEAREGHDPGIPTGYKGKSFPCNYCSWWNACWPIP